MPNQKGFASIIFILGILIASGLIIVGSFYIKNYTDLFKSINKQSYINNTEQIKTTDLTTKGSYANADKELEIVLSQRKAKAAQLEEETRITDFKEVEPTLISKNMHDIPPMDDSYYPLTRFIIKFNVYVPEEGDYRVMALLNDVVTLILDKNGKPNKDGLVVHLYQGVQELQGVANEMSCPGKGKENDFYGDNLSKPMNYSIELAVLLDPIRPGELRKIPLVFTKKYSYVTKPYKKSDFYLHCKSAY